MSSVTVFSHSEVFNANFDHIGPEVFDYSLTAEWKEFQLAFSEMMKKACDDVKKSILSQMDGHKQVNRDILFLCVIFSRIRSSIDSWP